MGLEGGGCITVSSDRKEKFLVIWACETEVWVWLGQRSVEFFEEGAGAEDMGHWGGDRVQVVSRVREEEHLRGGAERGWCDWNVRAGGAV